MAYKQIEYETNGRIAVVRTNRPKYRNAQSRLLIEEMDDAFIKAERDPNIHVVILRGAGDHFSAGHDLGTPEQLADLAARPYTEGTLGHLQMTWDLFVDASLRWRDLKKPTIAQVQGYCIFGGYLIASCMDLIIASKDALFLPSHLQLFTAPWDLGIRNAKAILFENRFIPADEAQQLGFVHKVVPRQDLEAETFAQAERIAVNDLLTLRMLKQSINGAQDAMGYRTSVHTAHSNYMVTISGRKPREEGSRKLGGVGAALDKLKKSDG